MAWAFVSELGLEGAELVINSVGCEACRPAFSAALLGALGERVSGLCGDCRRRAGTNPLRIFDCKVPADQPINRRPAALGGLPVRSLPRPFRGGSGPSGRLRALVPGIAPARPGPRLLHAHHLRDSRDRARGAERAAGRRPLRPPREAARGAGPPRHRVCGGARAAGPRAARGRGRRGPGRRVRGRPRRRDVGVGAGAGPRPATGRPAGADRLRGAFVEVADEAGQPQRGPAHAHHRRGRAGRRRGDRQGDGDERAATGWPATPSRRRLRRDAPRPPERNGRTGDGDVDVGNRV